MAFNFVVCSLIIVKKNVVPLRPVDSVRPFKKYANGRGGKFQKKNYIDVVDSIHKPLLDYIGRFIILTPEEQEYFLSILKHRRYLKRQFVLQAGDDCKYENYVLKGCLRAYFVDPNGTPHIIQFAIEDWWISDMASLSTGSPAIFNIDALEDTHVLQIERSNFNELFERVPKFERMFRLMLTKAFVAHQHRIIDNLCMPARDRYLAFLKRYRNIEQRVPQNQIASYLGMTPEFLSQIRKKIAEEG